MKPVIVSMKTIGIFGGQRTILVQLDYDGVPMEASFTGRSFGGPGLVTAYIEGVKVPVAFPDRYGKTFDTEWVENYFRKEGQDD
jgi:hypothetical protein